MSVRYPGKYTSKVFLQFSKPLEQWQLKQGETSQPNLLFLIRYVPPSSSLHTSETKDGKRTLFITKEFGPTSIIIYTEWLSLLVKNEEPWGKRHLEGIVYVFNRLPNRIHLFLAPLFKHWTINWQILKWHLNAAIYFCFSWSLAKLVLRVVKVCPITLLSL